MSNPYLLKVNDIWASLRGKTNRVVYFNAGIDAAAIGAANFRLSYQRIDKGNVDNDTASGETTGVAGAWGDSYLVNKVVFAAATGVTGDNVIAAHFPNAAFAAGADSVVCTLRDNAGDLRLSTTIELLHPPILQDIIEERPGAITSSIITLAGSPGVLRYIVIYTQFTSTAYQFGKEIIGTTLGVEAFGGPEERILLPIHGSYYQDGLGAVSQIRGLARSMGVKSSTDLQQAGWTGATLESLAGAGYTFIVPVSTGFVIPGSFVNLTLLPNDADFLNQEIDDLSALYAQDAIWFDPAGNTGDILGTNGTASNRSSSDVDTKTLGDESGLNKILVNGGTFASNEDFSNYIIEGNDSEALFNGNTSITLNFTILKNLRIQTSLGPLCSTATTEVVELQECIFEEAISFTSDVILKRCYWTNTDIISGTVNKITLIECDVIEDGSLTVNIGITILNVVAFKGNRLIIDQGSAADTHYIHMMGGNIEIKAGMVDGTVFLSGWGTLTDNNGGTTVNTDAFFDVPFPAVDVHRILTENLTESNAGDLANNQSQFFDVNPTTLKTVNDVGSDLTVVYQGSVWFDQASGNTGVVLGDDGIPTNKINNWADLVVLMGNTKTGLRKAQVFGTLDVAGPISDMIFEGAEGDALVDGISTQNLSYCIIRNMNLIGPFGDDTVGILFENCKLTGDISLDQGNFRNVDFNGNSLLAGISTNPTINIFDCKNSGDNGGVFTGSATYHIVGWKGTIKLGASLAGATHVIQMEGGTIELQSGFNQGSVILLGWGTLTDNKSGSATVDLTGFQELPQSAGAVTLASNPTNNTVIAESTWNALRASHVNPNSFGERVLADMVRWNGSATIDGVDLTTFNELMLAYVSGRFKVDFPNPGNITFFKQDNATPMFVMNVTTIERTRV